MWLEKRDGVEYNWKGAARSVVVRFVLQFDALMALLLTILPKFYGLFRVTAVLAGSRKSSASRSHINVCVSCFIVVIASHDRPPALHPTGNL